MALTVPVVLIFVFVFGVSEVTGRCDSSICCCPSGQVIAKQTGPTVSIHFFVASGSGCPTGKVVENHACSIQGNVCSNQKTEFVATKIGEDVTVGHSATTQCGYELRCISDTCKNVNNWSGQYVASSSKLVVVSTAYLLATTLSGLLL